LNQQPVGLKEYFDSLHEHELVKDEATGSVSYVRKKEFTPMEIDSEAAANGESGSKTRKRKRVPCGTPNRKKQKQETQQKKRRVKKGGTKGTPTIQAQNHCSTEEVPPHPHGPKPQNGAAKTKATK